MVLTDDNFCSIVEAIEQGRTIYANIQKFVFYLLSTNTAEVFTIMVPVIMGMPSPLLPIQILWMNLATDGAPAIALAMEGTEPGIMDDGPRPQDESIVEKLQLTGILIQAPLLTFLAVSTYMIGLSWNVFTAFADMAVLDQLTAADVELGIAKARTMTILMISTGELLRAYSCRSLRVSVFKMGLFTNAVMQQAVGVSLGATYLISITPRIMDIFDLKYLQPKEYLLVITLGVIPFVVDEATKYMYRITGFALHAKPNTQHVQSGVEASVLASSPVQHLRRRLKDAADAHRP